MSRFRLSPGGSRAHEPWFRVGTLDVGTTWLVVFLGVAGLLAYGIGGARLEGYLVFIPDTHWTLTHPWTLVTWPFAFVGSVFWSAISILFFWMFGRDLESSVFGRARLAYWLGLTTFAFVGILWGLSELAPAWASPLYGLQFLGLATLLLWVAEWPHRMFMFGIPAWVIGVIFLALDILQYLGDRSWGLLFTMLGGLAVSGFVARQFGALSDYAWIPKLAGNRPRRARTKASGPTVVAGPWPGAQPAAKPAPPQSSRDEERMDQLLAKISATGLDSLSSAERRELEELRLRRQR